ncbi:MAG: Sua5/YciO/YrdC/YwlC family protein [Lysobacteraceae bacterium]
MTFTPLTPEHAAAVLKRGGVLAYPTEGVWGLGCDPFNESAVRRVLEIKRRPAAKGMIVIAADAAQLSPWLRWDELALSRKEQIHASWPGPNTWLVPCTPDVPDWLRGEHDTLAARVTAHEPAAALCRAFGGPLVSTSANRASEPPARCFAELDLALLAEVDGVLAGETGGLDSPSTIRDGRSGVVLRG